MSSGASVSGTKPADGSRPAQSESAEDQHDPEPEVRDRDADEADRERGAVGHAAAAAAAEQSERHADQRPRTALASSVSSIVTGSRSRIMRPIGSFWRKSSPKSPRATPPSHRRYCCGSGSSRWNASRSALIAFGRRLEAEHDHRRVARHQPHEPEHEQAHAEQQRHGERAAGAPRTTSRRQARIRPDPGVLESQLERARAAPSRARSASSSSAGSRC